MRSSSLLIRFIDIGLIILFGFLSISDLENTSRLNVGDADRAMATVEPDEVETIIVNVAPGSYFSILRKAEAFDSGPILGAQNLEAALRTIVDSLRIDGKEEIVVVINPHAQSIVQQTIDVMDICTRLGISNALVRADAP